MENLEYVTQRIQCSYEEKCRCMGVVRQILGYGRLRYGVGVLALGERACGEGDFFLKEGLSMLVRGEPRARVEGQLYGYLCAGNYWGASFLEKMLVLQGILYMAEDCTSLRGLERALSSWFGIEFQEVFWRELYA